MVATSSSLKEYLKKYENKDEVEKKKKKKKKKTKSDSKGVIVMDEDPVWQKPVEVEDYNDSEDEEKPQVDEDIEVKRMKRLEQARSLRPIGKISEDGSGWAPVSHTQDDLSPPRQQRNRHHTPSPEPGSSKPSNLPNNDLSPPRQQHNRHYTPSPEPNTANDDLSPPRQRHNRHYSPSDQLEADLSPPRQRRNRRYTPSPEPGASKFSRTADDYLSPPRQRRSHRHHSSSPETRRHPSRSVDRDPDISPPRQQRLKESVENIRKNCGEKDLDLSPPRKIRKGSASTSQRPKTGLVTGKDVKEEVAKTKREDMQRFKDMDPDKSGRFAEPVYRDKKTGARLTKEQILETQKKEPKPKEIKLEWGKGLAQKREAEEKEQELELEKAKPFARTRDDPELDSMLKDRLRWGDPMAHLVKKKYPESVLANIGDNEKMKESGFIIPQDIPSHSWLTQRMEAAPNRYGIKPGRHWDGVDRSTGFEKKMFKRSNEKQASEKEAYLWSVADM